MYTINFTNSTKAPFIIPDNSANGPGNNLSNTPLTLLGKGYEDYGQIIWENMVKLLENFCSDGDIGPFPATEGQLWYSLKDNKLKVYKKKPSSNIIVPASPTQSSNTIEYYWEDLIDANYLTNKFGDGGISSILKTLSEGLLSIPLSEDGQKLLDLLGKFFLSINGGTLLGTLYLPSIDATKKYSGNDYNIAATIGYVSAYTENFVKSYLEGFGFDTSGFGTGLDGAGSSSSFLPLSLNDDPTVINGNNKTLKINSKVIFEMPVTVPDISIISDNKAAVNKSYADSIFNIDVLKLALDDTDVKLKISSMVGNSGTSSPIDYDKIKNDLKNDSDFIRKVADLIKLDVIVAIKSDKTLF